MNMTKPIGELLREWRQRRHLSQLDLSLEADVSSKHLSFVETGRAQPSREMVLRLAEQLAVPLRERNLLLTAAGYAPIFPERSLDDPALLAVRRVVDRILLGHEPYPALAIDRHWTLMAANRVIPLLLSGVAPELLQPPVNVIRLTLHPAGLAPRIGNLTEWRTHLLARLRRDIDITADPALIRLLQEVTDYPHPDRAMHSPDRDAIPVAVPFELITPAGTLSFFSTTTVFGTPVDITLSELALETFFPTDSATADALRAIVGDLPAAQSAR